MNYGEIKPYDIANGLGVRVSIFVSGCRNGCKNCFNQITWDFNYGKIVDNQTIKQLIKYLEPTYIDGLTILGGEPLEPENQSGVLELIKQVKVIYPNKTIWIYTGFTYEELTNIVPSRAATPLIKEIVSLIDVLVDGRFIEELKDISLKFCGSTNQRLIDIPKTLQAKQIITLKI